jgi:CcmD family protein
MKRLLMLALFVLTLALPAAASAQTPPQPSKPAAQDEFVPVTAPVNPQDTIPAPRLVAIAYGFIWVMLFGYVWSVRSRLSKVEREIEAVSRRVPERK